MQTRSRMYLSSARRPDNRPCIALLYLVSSILHIQERYLSSGKWSHCTPCTHWNRAARSPASPASRRCPRSLPRAPCSGSAASPRGLASLGRVNSSLSDNWCSSGLRPISPSSLWALCADNPDYHPPAGHDRSWSYSHSRSDCRCAWPPQISPLSRNRRSGYPCHPWRSRSRRR